MTQRERNLLVIVGVLLGCALLLGAKTYVDKAFKARRVKLSSLRSQLSDADLDFQKGIMAQEDLAAWEEWSLPNDPEQARALYKAWLTDLVNRAGVEAPKVKADATRSYEKSFDLHPFTVTGEADLRQLTALLHEFYTTRQLHRVRALTITPKTEKTIDLYMTIDAVSLPSAGKRDVILAEENGRVAGLTLAEMNQVILERNLFGPPNRTPSITTSSSHRFELGSRVRLKAEASDKDDDEVEFLAADLADLSGAEFVRGELRWTPRRTGDYHFTLEAIDDGIPARRSTKTIRISVVDPPPPRSDRSPPEFDWPKHTQLQGIVNSVGSPEVLVAWLKIRPLDKRLDLRVGDNFKVGSMSGVIRAIRLRELEYETEGRRYIMAVDDRLSDAREIEGATIVTSVQASEETQPPSETGGG